MYPPDRLASIVETGSGAEPDPVSTEDQARVMLSRVIDMSDQAAMTDDNTCTRCELGLCIKNDGLAMSRKETSVKRVTLPPNHRTSPYAY